MKIFGFIRVWVEKILFNLRPIFDLSGEYSIEIRQQISQGQDALLFKAVASFLFCSRNFGQPATLVLTLTKCLGMPVLKSWINKTWSQAWR
jgi:hypothetical protein